MQASLTSFDDTGNKELEIEVVTQEVTRLFKLTEGQLQKFGAQHSLSDSEQKANFRSHKRQPDVTAMFCSGCL